MPITQNFNIEWLGHNSQRNFPLAYESTSKDITGAFKLPDDFLVELRLSVPAFLASSTNYTLKTVQAYSTGYSVIIGYDNGESIVSVAAANILRSSHYLYKSYPLRGLGDFYDVSGFVTIGNLDAIDLEPPGSWSFDLGGGRLELDCVYPQIRGVTQLRIQNGGDVSAPITGDIILRSGNNFSINVIQEPGEDPQIIFNAISGAGLNEECVCEDGTQDLVPIKTINDIPGAPDGSFTLTGIECLTITPGTNSLNLEDKCAKPCCGCKELEPVVAALEQFGKQAATLETFMTNLEARVAQMDMVVLGSRLNDQGCYSQE